MHFQFIFYKQVFIKIFFLVQWRITSMFSSKMMFLAFPHSFNSLNQFAKKLERIFRGSRYIRQTGRHSANESKGATSAAEEQDNDSTAGNTAAAATTDAMLPQPVPSSSSSSRPRRLRSYREGRTPPAVAGRNYFRRRCGPNVASLAGLPVTFPTRGQWPYRTSCLLICFNN